MVMYCNSLRATSCKDVLVMFRIKVRLVSLSEDSCVIDAPTRLLRLNPTLLVNLKYTKL